MLQLDEHAARKELGEAMESTTPTRDDGAVHAGQPGAAAGSGDHERCSISSDSESVQQYPDAAARVSEPRGLERWYYAIEDDIGQGTVGMGVCLLAFALVMAFAFCVRPI